MRNYWAQSARSRCCKADGKARGETGEGRARDRAPHPKRGRGRKKEAKATPQEQDRAAGKNGAADDKTDSEEGAAQASAGRQDD